MSSGMYSQPGVMECGTIIVRTAGCTWFGAPGHDLDGQGGLGLQGLRSLERWGRDLDGLCVPGLQGVCGQERRRRDLDGQGVPGPQGVRGLECQGA